MTNLAKTAGLAGVLVAVFATANPELRAAQPDRAGARRPRCDDRTRRKRIGYHLLGEQIRWLARG